MPTLWNPYSGWGFSGLERALSTMDELRREMDEMLGEFGRSHPAELPSAWGTWPRSDLRDLGDHLEIWAEVPGLSEKDLEVSVTATSVVIGGERKADPPEGYTVHRKERGNIRFSRSFFLPAKVDPNLAEATVKHGVLELKLPKAAEAQPKRIAVKTS